MSSDRTRADEGLFSVSREGDAVRVETEPRLGVMDPLLGEGDFVWEEGGMGDLERDRVLLDGGVMMCVGMEGSERMRSRGSDSPRCRSPIA